MLIIGAGYLGEALYRLSGRSGWEVHTADKAEDTERQFSLDVSNRQDVNDLADKLSPPDVIVLCASTNRGGIEDYRAVFLEGSRNVREVFPDARVIMCSSTSVYDRTDGGPAKEDYVLSPASETAKILMEAESVVLEGKGTVARLSNLYGPGRSVLLSRILDDTAVIEGKGNKMINHIHRDDAASALLFLAERGESAGEIYNVSDDMPLVQKKLLYALAALFDKSFPQKRGILPDRKRAWSSKRVDNSKLRNMGWVPAYPSFLEAVPDLAPTMPGYEVRVDDDDEDEDEFEEDDE